MLRIVLTGMTKHLSSSDCIFMISKALKKLGHEVVVFSVDEGFSVIEEADYFYKTSLSKGIYNLRFYAEVKRFKPDMIFLFGSNWNIWPQTLKKTKRKIGSKIILWEGNLKIWEAFQVQCLPLYDHIFVLDSYFIPLLKDFANVRSVHVLGAACDPDEHCKFYLGDKDLLKFGADISFIGAGYLNRLKFFENLADYNLKIWGQGWQGISYRLQKTIQSEPVYGLKKTKIYNATKINLNIQGTSLQVNGLSCRVFEIAGCGGFALTENKKDILRYFKIGEEVAIFDDVEDLKKKVDYYLSHEDERLEIAQNAHERVLKEHTYQHRMQEMLGIID